MFLSILNCVLDVSDGSPITSTITVSAIAMFPAAARSEAWDVDFMSDDEVEVVEDVADEAFSQGDRSVDSWPSCIHALSGSGS